MNISTIDKLFFGHCIVPNRSSQFLTFFCSESLVSCIPPFLHPSFPVSLLSWIPPLLNSCIPHILHPNCPKSRLSSVSCIPPILHPTYPAYHLSFIPPVLHSSYPASLLSCIPPFLHPSFWNENVAKVWSDKLTRRKLTRRQKIVMHWRRRCKILLMHALPSSVC